MNALKLIAVGLILAYLALAHSVILGKNVKSANEGRVQAAESLYEE